MLSILFIELKLVKEQDFDALLDELVKNSQESKGKKASCIKDSLLHNTEAFQILIMKCMYA